MSTLSALVKLRRRRRVLYATTYAEGLCTFIKAQNIWNINYRETRIAHFIYPIHFFNSLDNQINRSDARRYALYISKVVISV